MIYARFVSEAASPIVGMLRRAATPREADAECFQNRQRARYDGVAWISETDGPGNAVLGAARVDSFDLFTQLSQRSLRNAEMIAGVVADLESLLVQLPDLFPCHVILLVGAE